jgi:hypothetical protein
VTIRTSNSSASETVSGPGQSCCPRCCGRQRITRNCVTGLVKQDRTRAAVVLVTMWACRSVALGGRHLRPSVYSPGHFSKSQCRAGGFGLVVPRSALSLCQSPKRSGNRNGGVTNAGCVHHCRRCTTSAPEPRRSRSVVGDLAPLDLPQAPAPGCAPAGESTDTPTSVPVSLPRPWVPST